MSEKMKCLGVGLLVVLMVVCFPVPDMAVTAGGDFSLQVTPDERTVFPGEKTEFKIVVESLEKFVGSVSLYVSGLPSGAEGKFLKNPLTVKPGLPDTTELIVTTTAKTPPGTYSLVVRGISGELVHIKTVILVVKGGGCPGFSVVIKADPPSGTPPLKVQFGASIEEEGEGSSKYSYEWSFGDGSTSTEASPVHVYEKAGTYRVTLTVKNDCGDTKTDQTTISVTSHEFTGALTKSFSPDTVLPGEETEIILTVQNTSEEDFTDVTVWDEIPDALKVLWTKGAVKPSQSGRRLTWHLDRIARGETLTLVAHCQVLPETPSGKIPNTAYMTHASLAHPIASNTAYLRVGFPDVKIEKSVNAHEAKPGDRLTYTLTIRNRSRIALTGIEVTDTLSDWLEFVSQSSPLSFERDGQQLRWRGSIEANTVREIRVVARIGWTVPYGTRISNEAFLTSEMGGIRKHSEVVWTSIAATHVTTSRIGFRKKAEIPQVDVGKIIRFRLTIRNGSGAPLLTPVIDDYLPQGFAYVRGSSVFNGKRIQDPEGRQHIRWRLPVIAPGETAILKYQTIIGTSARRGKNVNRAILNVTDNRGETYRLEAKALVSVSALSFTFYAAVEGNVYLDVDGNGIISPKDRPLEGVEVVLSKGERFISDKEGYFIFDNLYPGEYLIGINTVTLPGKYRVISPTPLPIVLMDGLTDYQEFLIGVRRKPLAKLSGLVFIDKNGDKTFQKGEPLPETFQVTLDKTVRTTGRNGRFVFSRLDSGRHELEIQSGGARKVFRVDIKTPHSKIEIPLAYHRLNITIQKGAR